VSLTREQGYVAVCRLLGGMFDRHVSCARSPVNYRNLCLVGGRAL